MSLDPYKAYGAGVVTATLAGFAEGPLPLAETQAGMAFGFDSEQYRAVCAVSEAVRRARPLCSLTRLPR